MIAVYFQAFAANRVQSRGFPPDSAKSKAFWRKSFADSFDDPHARIQVVQDDASGTIAGFAVWFAPLPTGKAHDNTPLPIDVFPGEEGGVPADTQVNMAALFNDFTERHSHYMKDAVSGQPIPHWYLQLIAVDPAWQGRGIGGTLLRYGEHQADAAGVPCYLDATPAGRSVYETPSHNFRTAETRTYFGGAYEHYFMVRDSQPAKADAKV